MSPRLQRFVLRSILFLLKHAALGHASCGEIRTLEREADELLREVPPR